MTVADPAANADAPPELRLTVEGELFDPERLVSIETWSEANRIPRARLVFFEGPDEEDNDFPLSAGDSLLPGKKIVVAAGYGTSLQQIHSGVVVRHSIRIEPGVSPQLVIETADKLVKMTLARGSAVSEEKSDKDVIEALVSAAGGTVGKNEASATPHEAFVQYHASAWDTLLLRAEANGCLVFLEGGKADVVSAAGGGEAAVELQFGDDIVALEATLDAAAPYGDAAVKSRAWSYGEQATGEGAARAEKVTAPGDFGAAELAEVFAVAPAGQKTGAWLDDAALADWSTAALTRSKLAAVRGTVRFQGAAAVKAGTVISLKGIGKRFEGDALVTSVSHMFRGGSWQTFAGFGMPRDGFPGAAPDVAQAPAAGLAPPIRGLHTGQVKKVAPDPTGDYRAQVSLPLIGDENGVWARLSSFYASSGVGAVFYPEVGDEVVLGFMDENPASPVILGSLHSSARKPKDDTAPGEANDLKAFVSRSLIEIRFDDKDKVLTLKTPGERTVRLDDTRKEVEIVDPFKNRILMSQSKVDLFSAAELNLEAKTNLSIKAGAKLTLDAKAAYALSAASIEEKAKGMMTIESSGMGTLKAGAVLTVQGALVKIN
jgi:phage protein D